MLKFLLVLCLYSSLGVAEWYPFRQWFPTYEKDFRGKWGNQCDAFLNVSKSESSWCQNASDCILERTPETQKANMAGSGILLGLTPVALSLIAPKTDLLAILGRQRPFLALLISASSGGIHFDENFSVDDPTKSLRTPRSTIFGRKIDKRFRLALSLLEYIFAIATAANVFYISYSISQRSIISWSCPNWGWVIGWSTVPVVLYFINLSIFNFGVKSVRSVRPERPENIWNTHLKSLWSRAVYILWEWELRPCCDRVLPHYVVRNDFWPSLARYIIPTIAYTHLIFGITIFSSILYVPFFDAFHLYLRYLASAVISKLLLTFELDTWKANGIMMNSGRENEGSVEMFLQKSGATFEGNSD